MKKMAKKNLVYLAGLKILSRLEENGHKAYFAGGFVRDLIVGREIKDIDIATSATPDEIEKIFSRTYETGKSFGVLNVLDGEFKFEVATFREERGYSDGRHPDTVVYSDDPSIDSARRDFTINSMFYSPVSEEIIDFQFGLRDLHCGLIRSVGNPFDRFAEDHLRIMRAIRFSAEYGFAIEAETKSAMLVNLPNLKKISHERIRDELGKMLRGFDPASAFKTLDDFGVLEELIPELDEMKNTPQDPEYHPEGDVMTHTLIMLSHLVSPSIELAWSTLLHDCGKPRSFSIGGDGKRHFYGHEETGARIANAVMSGFRMPTKIISSVESAVRNHMRIASVAKMRGAKISRLLSSEKFSDELELHRIDCASSHRKMDSYLYLLDRYSEFEAKPKIPKPIINGKDLIGMGFIPGPLFSRILSELHNRQMENEKLGKIELLDMIPELMKNKI